MSAVFNMMTPVRSMTKYNLDMLDVVDNEAKLLNFLRMEKWLADRPHHAGEAAKQWLKDLYQDNKLINNEWELGGRKVDLEPGHHAGTEHLRQADHIIPPATVARVGPASSEPTTTPRWVCRAGISACSCPASHRASSARASSTGSPTATLTTAQTRRPCDLPVTIRVSGDPSTTHPAGR